MFGAAARSIGTSSLALIGKVRTSAPVLDYDGYELELLAGLLGIFGCNLGDSLVVTVIMQPRGDDVGRSRRCRRVEWLHGLSWPLTSFGGMPGALARPSGPLWIECNRVVMAMILFDSEAR
jgi:hypothetical protein